MGFVDISRMGARYLGSILATIVVFVCICLPVLAQSGGQPPTFPSGVPSGQSGPFQQFLDNYNRNKAAVDQALSELQQLASQVNTNPERMAEFLRKLEEVRNLVAAWRAQTERDMAALLAQYPPNETPGMDEWTAGWSKYMLDQIRRIQQQLAGIESSLATLQTAPEELKKLEESLKECSALLNGTDGCREELKSPVCVDALAHASILAKYLRLQLVNPIVVPGPNYPGDGPGVIVPEAIKKIRELLALRNAILERLKKCNEQLLEQPFGECGYETQTIKFSGASKSILGDSREKLDPDQFPFPNNCTGQPQYPQCKATTEVAPAPPVAGVPGFPGMPSRLGQCHSSAALPTDPLTGVKNCLAGLFGLPGKFMCNDHVFWWKVLMGMINQLGTEEGAPKHEVGSFGICGPDGTSQHVMGVLCNPAKPSGDGTPQKKCCFHDNAIIGNAVPQMNDKCEIRFTDEKKQLFDPVCWTQDESAKPAPPAGSMSSLQHTYCCNGYCVQKGGYFCSRNMGQSEDNTGGYRDYLMDLSSPEKRKEFLEFRAMLMRTTGIIIRGIYSWSNIAGNRFEIHITIAVPKCACKKGCTIPVRTATATPAGAPVVIGQLQVLPDPTAAATTLLAKDGVTVTTGSSSSPAATEVSLVELINRVDDLECVSTEEVFLADLDSETSVLNESLITEYGLEGEFVYAVPMQTVTPVASLYVVGPTVTAIPVTSIYVVEPVPSAAPVTRVLVAPPTLTDVAQTSATPTATAIPSPSMQPMMGDGY